MGAVRGTPHAVLVPHRCRDEGATSSENTTETVTDEYVHGLREAGLLPAAQAPDMQVDTPSLWGMRGGVSVGSSGADVNMEGVGAGSSGAGTATKKEVVQAPLAPAAKAVAKAVAKPVGKAKAKLVARPKASPGDHLITLRIEEIPTRRSTPSSTPGS